MEREISELEVEKYNYERDERTGLKELKNMKKELKTMEDECEELQVDLAEAQSLLEHTDSEVRVLKPIASNVICKFNFIIMRS